jgi:hypothetical protein
MTRKGFMPTITITLGIDSPSSPEAQKSVMAYSIFRAFGPTNAATASPATVILTIEINWALRKADSFV